MHLVDGGTDELELPAVDKFPDVDPAMLEAIDSGDEAKLTLKPNTANCRLSRSKLEFRNSPLTQKFDSRYGCRRQV